MKSNNVLKSCSLGLLFLCLITVLFVSCGPNVNYIKRVQSLEEGVKNPTTVDELKDAIKKYEKRVEDIMAAEQQTGIWWKILATRYMDNKMYGQALNAFENAITYYPANPNLYYYVGVCAGYLANASLDYDITGDIPARDHYLKLSESAYKRAIDLNPNYVRALYGLAVLYVFELNESQLAIPLLEKVLSIEKGNTSAMFVLARAYYVNYEFQLAIDMYNRIDAIAVDAQTKADAEANRNIVMAAMHAN